MPPPKSDIIKAVEKSNGFAKKKATDAVENLKMVIKGTLESVEDLLSSDFCRFQMRSKAQLQGERTGDRRCLDARTTKCGGFQMFRQAEGEDKQVNRIFW